MKVIYFKIQKNVQKNSFTYTFMSEKLYNQKTFNELFVNNAFFIIGPTLECEKYCTILNF